MLGMCLHGRFPMFISARVLLLLSLSLCETLRLLFATLHPPMRFNGTAVHSLNQSMFIIAEPFESLPSAGGRQETVFKTPGEAIRRHNHPLILRQASRGGGGSRCTAGPSVDRRLASGR